MKNNLSITIQQIKDVVMDIEATKLEDTPLKT